MPTGADAVGANLVFPHLLGSQIKRFAQLLPTHVKKRELLILASRVGSSLCVEQGGPEMARKRNQPS